MIAYPVLVALAAVGFSLVAGGVALLVKGSAQWAAGLLLLAGVSCLSGALLDTRTSVGSISGHGAATTAWVLTLGLLVLAVVVYPRLAWRNPVDFIALIAVVAATPLAAVQSQDEQVLSSLGLAIGTGLIVHTWWRVERARDPERRALVWLSLIGGTTGLASGFLLFLAPTVTGAAVGILLWALLAPAMYVGVVLPDIVDVRSLVVRVVVIAVAGIAYLATLVLISSFLEILGGRPPAIGLLATVGAVAALALHPLQKVLRSAIDQLLYGVRPDPLTAATHLADRTWSDPAQALEAVRAELDLPYLSLVVAGRPEATSGTPVAKTQVLALDTTAELVVGLPPGELTLPEVEEQVLRLVTPVFVQLLRAEALTEDLKESRAQSIRSLEDERRRLRRDLHDGLGPRLTGIAMTADAAGNTLRSNPESAEKLLASLRAETTAAIADIRTLVYGMRPPALDELGLVGALRQQVGTLRGGNGNHLAVTIAAAELPALSAAVEVAAYRIVVEALTNVARHSDSPSASVTLDCRDDQLLVDVTDEGSVNGGQWLPGVGLASMHERAAETGGQVSASPTPEGGRVHAELPLSELSRRG